MMNSYISGEKIYLRAPTLEDAEGQWHEWLSDEETTRWMADQYWPNSIAKQIDYVKNSETDKSRLLLSIINKSDDKMIGVCNLSQINYIHRYCSQAILIGDKKFRNGPHMLEAVSLLLRTAFIRLNMRLVRSAYVETNEASEVIHKTFKFKEIGKFNDMIWDRGKYVPLVLVSLSQKDWMERNPRLVIAEV